MKPLQIDLHLLKLATALDAARSRAHLMEAALIALIETLPPPTARHIARRMSDQMTMQSQSAPADQPPSVAAAAQSLLAAVLNACDTGGT